MLNEKKSFIENKIATLKTSVDDKIKTEKSASEKSSIKIKKCTLSELDELQKICQQTFYETFASSNSQSDMENFLNNAYSKEKLREELLNKESQTFLALENKKALGFLKINFGNAQTEQKCKNSLEIQRIYVLETAKGKGIGSNFMLLAEQIAREKKLSCICLGVWEHNEKAKEFYAKKGFYRFGEHIFKLGSDEQIDFLMKKDLN